MPMINQTAADRTANCPAWCVRTGCIGDHSDTATPIPTPSAAPAVAVGITRNDVDREQPTVVLWLLDERRDLDVTADLLPEQARELVAALTARLEALDAA